MIILKEIKIGAQSIFQRIHTNLQGDEIDNETNYYRVYKVSQDNFDYFLLYDDQMNVISDVYKFINIHLASKSFNSREKAVYALRLLYCYLSLTKTDLNKLRRKDIQNLIYFLSGYSPNKGAISMKLLTIRSHNTINGYLNIYRLYLKFLDIDCEYLFETEKTLTWGINPLTEKAEQVSRYKSNLKTGTPIQRVPKYISVEEFSKIINIIRQEQNLQAECIVRLMFQFGLRLGEVLGLTFEDVTEILINDDFRPVLYIRNRLSDKKFQRAKTCCEVTDISQYKSKDYRTEDYGFQKVIITYDVYELINNYIEKAHTPARENHSKRYDKYAVADKTATDKYAENNYYIFINSLGRVLSEQMWNKYIRNVFEQVGISLDKETKKTNLNHRFRHGFAMFQVKYRNTPLLELKKMMRHASISSTAIYFNPTEEDEAKIKNEFVNELYDLIPTLREEFNYDY